MPARLTSPTVGLIPASPFDDDGQTIEPSVSVPIPAAATFAETPAPVPELEPQGFRSSAYGLRVRPPRPLHPLEEWLERMFAHSLRFVFPRITAPALRSCAATKESRRGLGAPTSASDPGGRHHLVGGVDVVLDQDWNSMKRTACTFLLPLTVERFRRSLERRD